MADGAGRGAANKGADAEVVEFIAQDVAGDALLSEREFRSVRKSLASWRFGCFE